MNRLGHVVAGLATGCMLLAGCADARSASPSASGKPSSSAASSTPSRAAEKTPEEVRRDFRRAATGIHGDLRLFKPSSSPCLIQFLVGSRVALGKADMDRMVSSLQEHGWKGGDEPLHEGITASLDSGTWSASVSMLPKTKKLEQLPGSDTWLVMLDAIGDCLDS